MTKEKLNQIFSKYAGAPIPTVFKDVSIKGEVFNIPQLKRDPDPILSAIEQDAKKHGLSLKIWFPGTATDSEQNERRLNVFVEEPKLGEWRISKTFFLG
jgi:hypothetical protein